MLARHIANAHSMLAPGGAIIIGSVPCRWARAAFHLHAFSPESERSLIRALVVLGRSYLGVDRIGSWFSYREFYRIAKEFGLKVTYFGCLQLPYRFHVRMDDASQV